MVTPAPGGDQGWRLGTQTATESKLGEIDPKVTSRYSLGVPESGEFRDEVFVRDGRFGPYVEQGDRKASIPQGLPPDELTLATALEMLDGAAQGDQPLGHCPETHKPIFLKNGRFGPYIQLGENDDEAKRNAGLLRGMNVEEIDLDVALKLLSLPRTLGEHAELNEPIVAMNGKFGPYVKCGAETRSLPADLSPLDITLEQAVHLLAQPKTRGRGAGKKEPLLSLAESPVTGKPVQVLDGRFGPYVTDGQTNATVPKDTDPKQLTFEAALDLLAARAALGGGGRKRPVKKVAKKAAPKTSAKKKTTAKSASKKATKKSSRAATKKSSDSPGD